MFKKVVKEELRVPAENASLQKLRDFVTRIGKKHRFSDKLINAFKLAVDEASTNIIRHSYRDRTGEITIRAVIRKESFTISLIDQGRYFDPTNVKNPDLKRYVAIGKKGGLGIFMIRKLVDDISYSKTTEGNELRLTKNKGIERKRRFALPKVPGSMRVKYYSTSMAIVSFIVIFGYFYNYFKTDGKILENSLDRMESISRIFAQNVIDGLQANDLLSLSKAAKVIAQEDSSFLRAAIVTDLDNLVQGTTDPVNIPPFSPFDSGQKIKSIRKDIQIVRKNLSIAAETDEYFLVERPVFTPGASGKVLIGRVYLLVSSKPIYDSVSQKRSSDLRTATLILVLANLGVGLLIFLILTPLQKLSNWVGKMGQEDIRDQIDIDTSNEIGKIAQAFGEITDKFRESQRSLADQERIQQEMHLAKEIQQTLLPAGFPDMQGYEIASYYESAKEVGGDYYDFVDVDRDQTGVVVADVSGKGVPGSLVMTMIRTALRTEARGISSAAEVLAKVNNFVIGDIRKGMFVTLFYTILDSRKRRVTFASAGHNPMILYRSSTKKTYYLNPKGFPVGISVSEKDLFRKSIEDDTIQLTKGDIILCYTDGITEAMNSKRELFGEERLLEVIRKYGHLRAKQFTEKLKEELLSFTEGQVQYDDITFVVIKEKMSAEESEFERAKEIYYDMLNGKSMKEACDIHGMPASTFSQKYREKLEKTGVEEFKKEFETTSVEAKHLSIEELTKIYDIIRKNPRWGATRISNQLNTEEYGFTQIPEKRIYDELVRKRLNTKALREAYVNRGTNKKRMKPPGTPMLTLDGEIIMDDQLGPKLHAPVLDETEIVKPSVPEEKETEKKPAAEKQKPVKKPPKKKSIEEKETSELILDDIIELFDKSRDSEEPAEPSVTEDLDEDLKPAEISETGELNDLISDVEYDQDIQKLLGNITEEPETAEQHADAEIDFSDLSASDYAQDLFNDKTNGDNKVDSAEPDTTGEKFAEEDVKKKTPEQIFNDLSVNIDDSTEKDVDFDDFASLIAGDEIETSEKSEEEDKFTETENADVVAEKDEKQDLITEQREQKTASPTEGKDVEEIFKELSVDIQGDENETVHDLIDQTDNNIEEFFDFISGEEINFQEELVDVSGESEAGSDGNKNARKRVKKRKIDGQQRLLIAGGHFYMQKKYDRAIQIFHRIIDKYPNNIEAHYNLGNSYFRLRRFDEAQSAYEKVCELDPTFLDAMENLGVIFANKRKFKEAIKTWKKILEFDPKREDIKRNIEKALKISRKIKS